MENSAAVEQIKKKIVPILSKYKAKRAALFGSAAKGTMGKDSDIDILVELKKDLSLLDFVGIKLELEASLKRKVDLVEYETIKPALRKHILSGQISILRAEPLRSTSMTF